MIVFGVVYSYRCICILVSRQMRKRSTHLLGLAKGRSHDGPDEPVVPRGHSAKIIHWPTSESTRDQTNPLGARSVRARTPDSFVSGAGAGAAGALAPAIAIRLVYEPRCRQRRHGRDSLRRRIPHSSAASDRERADGRGPRREYLHVAGRPATAFVQSGPGALQQVRRAIRTSTSRPSLLLLCYLR